MSKKFLEKIADELLKGDNEKLLETVVVFPNRRPKVFLKKYLKERITGSMWIPEMLSIDEFINSLSDLAVQDTFISWFELYEIHKILDAGNHKDPVDFINWAPIMLNDFNEADKAMVDIDKLFSYLSEIKVLERWHIDGSTMTDFEKNYIRFYTQLKDYHAILKKRLRDKGLCTAGMQYREVAEKIKTENNLPWKQFVFAGFNAMTVAEKTIVKELYQRGNTRIYWDIDEYYYKPHNYNLPYQEAGHFLRKIIPELKIEEPQWIEKNLPETSKEINIVAAPKKVAQVELTGKLVNDFQKKIKEFAHESLAVVLADETLLLPLLTSLPDDAIYNITMGLPLAQSPAYQLFNIWFEMMVLQEQHGKDKLQSEKLLSFLYNPVTRMLMEKSDSVIEAVKKARKYYLNTEDVKIIFGKENGEIYQLLTFDLLEPEIVLQRFVALLNLLSKKSDAVEIELGKEDFEKKFPIIRQQISKFTQIIKKAHIILNGISEKISIKVFQKIFNRLVINTEVDLRGEPLSGIQVMGMLETRLLDFENIIVIGANEGNLPKTGFADSFIPVDVKRDFGLPLPYEKTAIFAYHFFRLLQRTKTAYFIYDSEPASFGSSEKSRFLYQLEMEAVNVNKQLKINEIYFKVDKLPEPGQNKIVIKKEPAIFEKLYYLADKGFSASSLNNFIECPMKFYFSKIAGIKPPEDLKVTIEPDVFGSVVHDILEKVYGNFTGKDINPGELLDELKKIDDYLQQSLEKYYGAVDVKAGKNILLTGVIKNFVEKFVKFDSKQLEKEPKKLIGVEEEILTDLNVENVGTVNIYGKIDRIDRIKTTGETRIIDYKTGKVENKDISLKDWERLIQDKKHAKVFQTLLYGWLYQKEKSPEGGIKTGLYSLRTISEGFKEPKLPKDSTGFVENFESVLKDVIRKIFDKEVPFVQTEDKKSCKYCDFKSICNR